MYTFGGLGEYFVFGKCSRQKPDDMLIHSVGTRQAMTVIQKISDSTNWKLITKLAYEILTGLKWPIRMKRVGHLRIRQVTYETLGFTLFIPTASAQLG
jgi:hypothetical protein